MQLVWLLIGISLAGKAKENKAKRKLARVHRKKVKKFERLISKRRDCNTFPIYDSEFNISVGFTMTRQMAYTGEVIDVQKFKDVRNCAKYCANRAGCSYFSFNHQSADCSIFMETNGGVTNEDVTSGQLNPKCGSKFYPIGISSSTQFIIHHYTDPEAIVQNAPITANTLTALLALETMMGPFGGKGDYWIDRDFKITAVERTAGAAHFVFKLSWHHYFRVFEDTLSNSNVTKFIEAQSKFVKGVVDDHTRYIEKNVRSLLNPGLIFKQKEFILETFKGHDTFEIVTDIASCEFYHEKLVCTCPEGYSGKGLNCRDKNECYRIDSCPGQCLNLPGNYVCLEDDRSGANGVCPPGYIGAFPDCVDVNECQETDDLCPGEERCVNTPGSYTCSCPDGYGGPFGCAKMAKSVCLSTVCDEGASCEIDDNGNEYCKCNDGLFGNGHICSEVDECRAQTHNCDANASCQDLPGNQGGFECSCNWTWQGNGTYCEDIDECSTKTHQCHFSAQCQNHENGYSCECASGYVGNGFHCHDINECAISNQICGPLNQQQIVNGRVVQTQSELGICINTEGSYECVCPEGYEFTRGHCHDIDECASSGACFQNAVCTNTPGSFECACEDHMVNNGTACIPQMLNDAVGNSSARFINYEYDNYDYNYQLDLQSCDDLVGLCIEPEICLDTANGPTCQMPLEIHTGTTHDYDAPGADYQIIEFTESAGLCSSERNTCPQNSDCWELVGGHSCTCHEGYEWNDDGECINIDECSAGSHTCDVNAECLDLYGSYTCICNYGFEGNGKTCTEGASVLTFIKLTRVKMNEAIDSIVYRGPKNMRPRTYDIMKKKGGRVLKQLYRLLSSDYCDRYAPFENQDAFARHREKPTRYTVAEAIDALETFAKLNCDLRGYAEFEDKYERFKNNFLAYKIMG